MHMSKKGGLVNGVWIPDGFQLECHFPLPGLGPNWARAGAQLNELELASGYLELEPWVGVI